MSEGATAPTGRGRLDLGELYLSSIGRVGRLGFWAGVLSLVAALWLSDRFGGLARLLIVPLIKLPLAFAGGCLIARRLHDRDLSGWWMPPILLAFALAWPEPRGLVGAVSLTTLILAAWPLGAMPGRAGWNRFGDAPVGRG